VIRIDDPNGDVVMTNSGETIDQHRRRLVGATALAFAAAELGLTRGGSAQTASPSLPQVKREAHTSFGPLKQINAGVLSVGYVEAGPPNGSPVILLHGWPYDIHDYIDVAPVLAARGYRVIIPHLRGHGSTHFLDTATPRSGQQAAIGVDVIALMDALKIPTAVLAGYDWGGRAACVVAAPLARALHRAGSGQRLSYSRHRPRRDAAPG